MSRWLEGLNPEQREAVQCLDGPLLVLAGAGSGKTRVITHRMAHLMDRVAGEHVLGVTFTNKAAEEMRQRLHGMIGAPARDAWLSTFHSLGLEMLRVEASRGRRRAAFTVFDQADQMGVLRDITRSSALERSYDLGAILQRISAWKNLFLAPDQLKIGEDPYDQAAAELYGKYLELMRAYRAYDFDDLIVEPCRRLEESKAVRQRWSSQFQYVLVDEYQDTNHAQLRLLRAIGGEHGNVCVVGDDDQSIYGWRGAEVRNILEFEKDFPGARKVLLMRNYRSVGAVLDAANRVIAVNPDRHEKQMLQTRNAGAPVRLVITPTGEDEAEWVARSIRERVDRGLNHYADFAVLYRSNTLGRDLEMELRGQGVKHRVLGGTAFFDRKEVKDLHAYLRLCENPGDEISLRRVINFPPRGIGPRTLEKLSAYAEREAVPLMTAVDRAEAILTDDDRSARAVTTFRELLRRTADRVKRGGDLKAGVNGLIADLDLGAEIQRSSESPKVMERRLELVNSVVAGVGRYTEKAQKPNLREYLSHVALLDLDADQEEDRGDLVTLSTLHGAKGLEWSVVFLIGLEEGLLPHDRTLNPSATDMVTGDIAEERRLCYVGMTRARDELILSRAAQRRVRGRPVDRTPSRFLDALPVETLQVEDLSKVASAEQVTDMVAALRSKLGW